MNFASVLAKTQGAPWYRSFLRWPTMATLETLRQERGRLRRDL
ncbi:MAG: hypothetical protein ACC658_03235 [Acidimicrobiia bacterium]